MKGLQKGLLTMAMAFALGALLLSSANFAEAKKKKSQQCQRKQQ